VGKKGYFFGETLELLNRSSDVGDPFLIKCGILVRLSYRFGFWGMTNVLLGMLGRNLHMDLQIFPPKNDTKFSFSDVP
jgi:hypothetical protein